MTSPHHALAALAVQYWKVCAALERELALADPHRTAAGAAQLRFSRQRLDTILEAEGLTLATYDGRPWTPDLPASPIDAEDIADPDAAIVALTVEPTIIGPGGILHPGKITLKDAS